MKAQIGTIKRTKNEKKVKRNIFIDTHYPPSFSAESRKLVSYAYADTIKIRVTL